MTRSVFIGLVVLVLALFAMRAAPVHAAQQGALVSRPNAAVDPANCVTAECHANVKQHKAIHGPVNVNACDACHKPLDVKAHTFELTRQGADLCTFCHQPLDLKGAPVVHKPVEEGQCHACHDPHGGTDTKFLRGATTVELCNTCHQDVVGKRKHVHGPASAGACLSCHPAHAAPHEKLLVAEGKDLCLSCHADMKDQMAKATVKHAPAEKDCAGCHDPHASDFTMMVKQEPAKLCGSCHDKERQAALNATHKHSVVTSEDGCLRCHTSHGSTLADLMKQEPAELCLSCHDKKITADGGRVVAAVAEVKDPKLVKHGPIRDGNCSGCHNTHGSEVAKLLAKPYPEPFYQAFAAEKYELCFTCHDKQLVQLEQTTGLTGFRNGEQNLHYLHVNKEKGRNCRACHAAHASPNELHVRDSVPYGKWAMPIKFTKTETGGSCAPGCHKPYDYDRDAPVNYAAPAAAVTSTKDGRP
jgi:predicted CXXCH cytochrome family protein